MRVLVFFPKMSLLLILGFFLQTQITKAQYNKGWILGFGVAIEKSKNDLYGCDSCYRNSFLLDTGEEIVTYPKAQAFTTFALHLIAEKRISKRWSFLTGFNYIARRRIGYTNQLIFTPTEELIGNETFMWKNEIEIPLQFSHHLLFFKSKLELSPSLGFNFGTARRYSILRQTPDFSDNRERSFRVNGLIQRVSPMFGFRVAYNPNADTKISLQYYTQTMLPFLGAIEEPVFTSGIRFGYQRSLSSITSLLKAKK